MTSTIVKISILAVAVFAVAGLVFAGIGQSAHAVFNNNFNGGNSNHQHNSCSDDCFGLKNQNNQANQGSSYQGGNTFTG